MGKITDAGYVFPLIEALSPHEIFETGANRPLLITGVNTDGEKGDYVVKFRGAARMSNEACMRETLSLFVAAELDIKAVSPVVVNISSEFVELLLGNDAWQPASQSLGYNFGSEYIKGLKTLLPTEDLNQNQLPHGQAIFAFDVLVLNSDRTNSKPNMLTDGHDIAIFDHELAFGFIFDLFKNPEPRLIKEADMVWINQHCLLQKIKDQSFDYESFSAS